ncbi:MAG: STAS domain-containing protein [Allorhizobium sp.]
MQQTPEIVKFNDPLTIRSMNTLHQELLQSLNANDAVALEIPTGAQVDISFVQLIEAARRYALSKDKPITLINPADGELLEVLRRGGFLDAISAGSAQFWLHQGKVQ